MKRVLITGGAGFIGSNLTHKLLTDTDYHVVSLDNFDSFYSRAEKEANIEAFQDHPRFTFVEGDILNADDLEKTGDVAMIIHLAAKAGVRPSIAAPALYQEVNVNGTQSLLEFAKRKNIKQFIFASSSSVYGLNSHVPWKEDEKLLPISPYASSKLSAEMLGHVYSHLYGIRFLALRFFTVYGPGQRPDLAIHKFFHAIINDKPIQVFGDGMSSRDYTFVDDIVHGISKAIGYRSSNFEIINLGNHTTVTLNELVHTIEDICGKKAIIDRQPEQPGDVRHTYANISKAAQLLDYHPNTRLKDGLLKFYEWYKVRLSFENAM